MYLKKVVFSPHAHSFQLVTSFYFLIVVTEIVFVGLDALEVVSVLSQI